MFLEPLSYVFPFENSLYITYGVLFLFINYDKLVEQMNELYSSTSEANELVIFFISVVIFETILRKIILLPGIPQCIRTHCNIEKEVSFFKLAETVYGLVSLVILFYRINIFVFKLCIIWFFGYIIIRLCVQIYSLFVYKPQSFTLDETHHKQTPSKEPLTKDETEELKEETHENITS